MSILTCKETEKMIPQYIAGTLNDDEVLRLIKHINECGNCKEELTIQRMVSVSMDDLDKVAEINVEKELDLKESEIVHKRYIADLWERCFYGALFAFLSGICMVTLLLVL